MARAPGIELWHFGHMPAPGPTHPQLRSAAHGLSLPWRFGDQGQSYVACGPGVGGGAGVEASMRFHCWSGVTPSFPRHASPLMYFVPPYICIAVMQIVSPPKLDLSVIVWSPVSATTMNASRPTEAPAVHAAPRAKGDYADEQEIDRLREREETPRRGGGERRAAGSLPTAALATSATGTASPAAAAASGVVAFKHITLQH